MKSSISGTQKAEERRSPNYYQHLRLLPEAGLPNVLGNNVAGAS
jgi:hypothetical protein